MKWLKSFIKKYIVDEDPNQYPVQEEKLLKTQPKGFKVLWELKHGTLVRHDKGFIKYYRHDEYEKFFGKKK